MSGCVTPGRLWSRGGTRGGFFKNEGQRTRVDYCPGPKLYFIVVEKKTQYCEGVSTKGFLFV